MGAAGQGRGHSGACVLVLGEHVAARVGRCTGQQRGCDVLHAPLMSFLGQARPRGKLISKQAAERSPCSPLPPPPPPLLLAPRPIALFLMFPIVVSSFTNIRFFSPTAPQPPPRFAFCRYGGISPQPLAQTTTPKESRGLTPAVAGW